MAEQLLNIGALDAVGRKLRWQNLVVQKRHGNQVRQAVIGIFFRADDALVALFATADDLVGDVEGLDVDAIDLGRGESVLSFQLERGVDRRLGVNLGIVALDHGPRHPFQILARPVDVERPGDRVDEAFVAFEHFERSGDASAREERRPDASGRGVGIRQPFPVRERTGPGHA